METERPQNNSTCKINYPYRGKVERFTVKRLYYKIRNIMQKIGELNDNYYLLDVRQGTLTLDKNTGRLFIAQPESYSLLSGSKGEIKSRKVFYKDSKTPYCLLKEIKQLYNEVISYE